MGLLESFAKQFQKPEGFWGRMAGFLMSKGAEKSEWTITLLNPDKRDRVLEIGFGTGLAIEMLSRKITEGRIVGIEISELMLKSARNRNKESISNGIVELQLANVSDLPAFKDKFDYILSVNNFMFWDHPVDILKHLRSVIKPNGKIAITVQPRMKGANDETVKEFGNQIDGFLRAAGYSDIQIRMKQMKPISSVCVIAVNRI